MGSPFLQQLRMQSLFPTQGQIPFDQAPDISQVPIGQQQPVFQPDTRMQDAVVQMLQNMPQRKEPGLLRKIAGAAANIGYGQGSPQSQEAMYGPYGREMQDWQAKFEPTYQAAGLERQGNNQLRQIASDAMRDRNAQERLDIQWGDLRRKEDTDKANIAIREKRATTYDWKARNPNMEIETDKDGNLIGVNPQTGAAQFITGPDGKPIKGNELSAEDKANLQIKVARIRSTVTGDQQIRVETERQKNRMALLERRAQIARDKAKKEDSEMSASQDAAAWKLAREQYIADNPGHSSFWDEKGMPTGDATGDDTYTDAIDDIRVRYNRIKARAGGAVTPGSGVKPPAVTPPAKTPNKVPPISEQSKLTKGTPPPANQRKVGDIHVFDNGNTGKWDGTKWAIVSLGAK